MARVAPEARIPRRPPGLAVVGREGQVGVVGRFRRGPQQRADLPAVVLEERGLAEAEPLGQGPGDGLKGPRAAPVRGAHDERRALALAGHDRVYRVEDDLPAGHEQSGWAIALHESHFGRGQRARVPFLAVFGGAHPPWPAAVRDHALAHLPHDQALGLELFALGRRHVLPPARAAAKVASPRHVVALAGVGPFVLAPGLAVVVGHIRRGPAGAVDVRPAHSRAEVHREPAGWQLHDVGEAGVHVLFLVDHHMPRAGQRGRRRQLHLHPHCAPEALAEGCAGQRAEEREPAAVVRVAAQRAAAVDHEPAVDPHRDVLAPDTHAVRVEAVGRVHRVLELGPPQHDAVRVEGHHFLLHTVGHENALPGAGGAGHDAHLGLHHSWMLWARGPGPGIAAQVRADRAAVDDVQPLRGDRGRGVGALVAGPLGSALPGVDAAGVDHVPLRVVGPPGDTGREHAQARGELVHGDSGRLGGGVGDSCRSRKSASPRVYMGPLTAYPSLWLPRMSRNSLGWGSAS